mgnify:CR=1 FL=1
MLFVLQGSYFKRLIVPQVLLFIFSFLIYFYQTHIATEPVPLNPSVFAILGISLAIFHGFCNNAAYDRFWEGRKLWGELVLRTRNLSRQCLSLIHDSQPIEPANRAGDVRVRMVHRAIAFVHALRLHLRAQKDDALLQRWLRRRCPANCSRPLTTCQSVSDARLRSIIATKSARTRPR